MTQPVPISNRTWGIWLAATLTGIAVIALPDDDHRLFSISDTHGPSAVDAVGVAILLGGWLLLTVATVVRWQILMSVNPVWLWLGVIAYVLGLVILVPTVLLDLGAWWIAGAALMALVQIAAALAVSR